MYWVESIQCLFSLFSIDWSFLSCFIPKCFCSYSEEWKNVSGQSACKGETEHPRGFVLRTAPLAGKTVMGEMGRFSLVGLSVCFPVLRLVSWRCFLLHVPVRIWAGSLDVCCLMAACVGQQAPRAENLLWDSVQPVSRESVRQDTRKRDSWKGKSIPDRVRKEIQLKNYLSGTISRAENSCKLYLGKF